MALEVVMREKSPQPVLRIYIFTTLPKLVARFQKFIAKPPRNAETGDNNYSKRRAGAEGWGDDLPFTGAAYERVGGTVSCVLTRFHLRSALWLPLFFLAFRRVYRQARETVPGLIKAVFLVEGTKTCYTLSLWRDDRAIIDFGTRVHAHVSAANWAFARTFRKDLGQPEIWSVQWRLWAVSHNLNWDGMDLREVLAGQLGKRPEEIAMGVFRARRGIS